MQTLEYSDTAKFQSALRNFCDQATVTGNVSDVVSSVLRDVRQRGDEAVFE
ncbi:MAG: histidinol dehydrogenase, partial [Verrucomicrobia bacterium]|nr:histidinol dehydrogenase [Verrucomicrobiota bacterium]